MHEPDKEPETGFVDQKRFTVQWIANISLGCAGLTIIGMLLSLLFGKLFYLVLSLSGILLAAWAIHLAKKLPDERIRTTGVISITINIVLFIIVLIITIFFREAVMSL